MLILSSAESRKVRIPDPSILPKADLLLSIQIREVLAEEMEHSCNQKQFCTLATFKSVVEQNQHL